MTPPVTLGVAVAEPMRLADLARRVEVIGDDVDRAIGLAVDIGSAVTTPGDGQTLLRWQTLATLGAADLTAARVVEPHVDALAILREADAQGIKVDLAAVGADNSSSWGVFAAEAPSMSVTASLGARGWTLAGTKPWCSLADRLSHALITARTPDGRGLFAIPLQGNGIRTDPSDWVSRGLTHVTSGPIQLAAVPAVPVGPAQWYLDRPGFAWGGIGVAAVWLGGAIGVARLLAAKSAASTDPLRLMNLGAVDSALFGASAALVNSAAEIDRNPSEGAALLAARVRAVVADAAELTLIRVGHALGPAPLALDERHSRRVADLQLYLRQHHAERDQAALGSLLSTFGDLTW